MKRVVTALALMILIIPATSFASAVLIDAQGKVEVTIAGKSKPGKAGMELPDGSTVKVKEGSAQVLLESGAMDEVPGGSTYTVGQKSPSGERADMGSGISLAMRELAASGEGPTVHGMVKKVGGPVDVQGALARGADKSGKQGLHGVYPRGTAIVLGEMASFTWSAPVAFKSPAIVIDDANRRRLSMEAIEKGSTSFKRASTQLKLRPGARYSWFLAAREGKEVRAKTARFDFSTLPQKDATALDGEMARVRAMKISPDGQQLLISQLYFKAGLYHDMVETLKPLYARTGAPFAKKLLLLGYQKMGLNDEAAKYR